MTFLQRYLHEGATEESVADEVTRWEQAGRSVPLHEFLGLTRAEVELLGRDRGLFFGYLRSMRAARCRGCG